MIADLRLHDHGLRIVERRAQNFLPAPDGRYLLSGEGRTEREIAKFSPRDAERYAAFDREIDVAADVLRELVLQAPPNLASGFAGLGELIKAGTLGRKLKQLCRTPTCARSTTCSPARPASISTAGSRTTW